MPPTLAPHRRMNDPEPGWVAAARAGDRHAFAQLVAAHQDRVFGLCWRLLGRRDLAEETAQDVFLAVWRALPTFRGDASVATWIRRITVNTCLNRRAKLRRRAADRHDALHEPAPGSHRPRLELLPGPADTQAPLHRRQARDQLEAALAELPQDQRDLITLRDLEDLDYEEIATLLDVPRGTVKSRLHRARAKLAEVLRGRLSSEDVFDR